MAAFRMEHLPGYVVSNANMLEVRNLTKRYRGIAAVDRVSFTIRPGEILGYLGPNGAGKSTTVKMLTGLLEPSEGEIRFHGDDVMRDIKAFQGRIGYVAEEAHLYPHVTGREYLQLAGRLDCLPLRPPGYSGRAAGLSCDFRCSSAGSLPSVIAGAGLANYSAKGLLLACCYQEGPRCFR